jgi:hypothetical protein
MKAGEGLQQKIQHIVLGANCDATYRLILVLLLITLIIYILSEKLLYIHELYTIT